MYCHNQSVKLHKIYALKGPYIAGRRDLLGFSSSTTEIFEDMGLCKTYLILIIFLAPTQFAVWNFLSKKCDGAFGVFNEQTLRIYRNTLAFSG